MNDILFDGYFFLMEFVAESGTLSTVNFGYNDLVARVPVKESIRIS